MAFVEFVKNNSTLIIAIYGAILSTIVVGWNIYNTIQDRPKVKVIVNFGAMQSSQGVEGPFLFVRAVNKGRRSVYLSSFGLRSGKDDLIPLRVTGMPCELKGSTSHTEWFTPDELKKMKGKRVFFAWYRDETGKVYKNYEITRKLDNYFKSEKKNI